MHRKNVLLSLLLFHACLVPAKAVNAWNRGQNMADTMLNMMDAMGQFSRDYVDSRSRNHNGFSQAWESMTPDGNGAAEPKSPVVSGQTRHPEHPGAPPPTASTNTRLEGGWLGQGGERLTIWGSRFRLDAGPDRLLEGVLQIRGKLLALHSTRHRQTWIFEYAEHQGRLALRSAQGQLLLYRRVDPRDSRPPQRRR